MSKGRYTQGFKQRVVARLLPPESAPIATVSQEQGVSAATLERWRAEAMRPPRLQVWTAVARLQAVITTATMEARQRRAWCQVQGVLPSDLQQWRESATAALSQGREAPIGPRGVGRGRTKRDVKMYRAAR